MYFDFMYVFAAQKLDWLFRTEVDLVILRLRAPLTDSGSWIETDSKLSKFKSFYSSSASLQKEIHFNHRFRVKVQPTTDFEWYSDQLSVLSEISIKHRSWMNFRSTIDFEWNSDQPSIMYKILGNLRFWVKFQSKILC